MNHIKFDKLITDYLNGTRKSTLLEFRCMCVEGVTNGVASSF